MVLYTEFQSEPSTSVMESTRKELDTIMSPIGVRFEWRSLSSAIGHEPAVELVVVHFKGHCDLSAISPLSDGLQVLGLTYISGGVILPFSDIDCDHISRFIQRSLMMERTDTRDRIFGRAIARVLAHELYHIFANTSKHGTKGIGRPTYLARELVSDDFHFDKQDWIAVRKGKIIANLENAANSHWASPPPDPPNR